MGFSSSQGSAVGGGAGAGIGAILGALLAGMFTGGLGAPAGASIGASIGGGIGSAGGSMLGSSNDAAALNKDFPELPPNYFALGQPGNPGYITAPPGRGGSSGAGIGDYIASRALAKLAQQQQAGANMQPGLDLLMKEMGSPDMKSLLSGLFKSGGGAGATSAMGSTGAMDRFSTGLMGGY